MAIFAGVLAVLFFPVSPGFSAMAEAPTAGAVTVGELAGGRWALLFVSVRGGPGLSGL